MPGRGSMTPIDRSWIKSTKKHFGVVQQSDASAEFDAFRKRVLNVLVERVRLIRPEGVRRFYQVVSEPIRLTEAPFGGSRPDYQVVIEKLWGEKDPGRFLFLLQVVLELPFFGYGDVMGFYGDPRATFINDLQEAIRMSEVDVELTVTQEQVIIRPRGERELEQHLVDGVLGMLQGSALAHFTAALKCYGKSAPTEHVKSAESLRRALEEFLRFRLSNSKGLNSNISELLARLKRSGRDPTVRNIIFQTFNCLDQYFNDNSKHADGDIDAVENEYLIYQTGLLIRYVDRALE
jgi:hypothetical protein